MAVIPIDGMVRASWLTALAVPARHIPYPSEVTDVT